MIFYVIKYVLVLLTAVYATYQAFRQVRERRDHRSDGETSAPSSLLRTAWHPVMLLVGVMSIASIIFEVLKDVEDHRKRAELLTSLQTNITKTETVLAEARRLAQPIKEVHATFFITVPLSDPALANYRKRIEAGRVPVGPETTEPDTPVAFHPPSRVWPSLETEKLAHMLLSWVKIDIDVYKNPLSPDEYASLLRGERPIPDLQMGTSIYLDPPNLQAWGFPNITMGLLHLRLGLRPPRAELATYSVLLSSRSATGKVGAVTDLIGCRLFLRLTHVAGVSDAELQKRAKAIARESIFSGISLDVRGSLILAIPATSFQKRTDPSDGMPFYVFTFPTTEEAFRGLQQR